MGICDVPVISTVCETAGEAAASLVSAPFDWLAQAMGGAAGWLFEAVWTVFDTTTLIDVQRPGFVSVFNLVFGIAVFVMLLFFALQLITGMIRRDPTALTRAALGLGKSVLGSFVVITLVALLLEITDQLCVGIIQAAGETTETMGDKIAALVLALSGLSIAAPGVGAIIMIFLAGLAIASAAIVWLSLLIRKSLLLVAVALAPLAFSGSSWDAARGWVGKWAMFVIALILSKLVLVVIFLVAITQVAAPIDLDLASVSDPLSGIVLMALAGFAPYLTYRFLAFVGTDYYGQAGAEDDAKRALNRPIPVPSKPSGDGPKKVLDGQTSGDGGGGSGSGAGGAVPPKPTPTAGSSGGASGAGAGAGASGSAGTGASAGAGAGAGAAAAGPAAAVVVGAQVVKGAATAGPKAGTALAGEAETAAAGAGQTSAPPSPSTPAPTAPPSPRPTTPNPPKPTKE